jgi:hypothetical protein
MAMGYSTEILYVNPEVPLFREPFTALPNSMLFGFPFRFLRPKFEAFLPPSALAVQFLLPLDLLVLAHNTSFNNVVIPMLEHRND